MYSYSSIFNVFLFCDKNNKSIWIPGEVKLSQPTVSLALMISDI